MQYEAKIAHLRQCIINEPDRRQQFEDEIDYVISTRNKELADGEPDSDSEEEESEEEDWSEDDESDSDSESGSEREEMECEFALEEVQNVNGALQYTGRFLCFS